MRYPRQPDQHHDLLRQSTLIDLTSVPIDITDHIVNFRNLLNSSWPHLDALMKTHDWDEDGNFSYDWIQVNWALLISSAT